MAQLSNQFAGQSLSHGTMRPIDLLQSFGQFVREQKIPVSRETNNAINLATMGRELRDAEAMQWAVDELFDAINGVAPAGHYFGAHPGDGSDYGFWQVEED